MNPYNSSAVLRKKTRSKVIIPVLATVRGMVLYTTVSGQTELYSGGSIESTDLTSTTYDDGREPGTGKPSADKSWLDLGLLFLSAYIRSVYVFCPPTGSALPARGQLRGFRPRLDCKAFVDNDLRRFKSAGWTTVESAVLADGNNHLIGDA
jgi:hypothetical protein